MKKILFISLVSISQLSKIIYFKKITPDNQSIDIKSSSIFKSTPNLRKAIVDLHLPVLDGQMVGLSIPIDLF